MAVMAADVDCRSSFKLCVDAFLKCQRQGNRVSAVAGLELTEVVKQALAAAEAAQPSNI